MDIALTNATEHSDYIITIAINWWFWAPILLIVTAIAGLFIYKHFKKKSD
jgi:hypothetical protein